MNEVKVSTDGNYRFNGLYWALDISSFTPGQAIELSYALVWLRGKVERVGKKKVLVKVQAQLGGSEFAKWAYPDELRILAD